VFGCVAMDNSIRTNADKFSHEIKKMVLQKKKFPGIVEIAGKDNQGKVFKSSVIHIKEVKLEDFVKVVFTEILKYPYVMDRGIEFLDKKVDVEIAKAADVKNLYAVVVSLLEKSGIEVEDVEGVLVLTVKEKENENRFDTSEDKKNEKKTERAVPSDCVYTYKPLFVRAVDLEKSLTGILANEKSKILINETNNCLIFRSTEKERRAIVKLLKVLDEQQKQVAVDVTLAEVSLVGDLSIGLEGFLHSNLISIEAGATANNGYGLTGSIMVSDWLKAIIQMGQKNGMINIRSNPYLVIADGSSSSIEIGSEYPILSSVKSSGDTSVINSVEYRKTGILLNIKPIVSGESVHLVSSIELSEGQKNEISSIQSPSILNRKIQSSVILESGQSLIIGGLISDSKTKDEMFFPGILGKIHLQTGKSETFSRVEIIVVLHVSVISKEKDYDTWFERLAVKYENQNVSIH
jgi:type II secretory pathway component GspD/PulD (secretin)